MRSFAQVPITATVSIGGFTTVKSNEWREYLNRIILSDYPDFYQAQAGRGPGSQLWKNNACILESLDQYLFHEFGVSIPPDNLFKIYNADGEGVLPAQILEAISAVVEPLGLEIARVLVADQELREGMGLDDRVVDLSYAREFDLLAGLCMINIRNGYSHAFFWKPMETARFFKEQFRMAIMIRWKVAQQTRALIPLEGIEAYCHLLEEQINHPSPLTWSPSPKFAEMLLEEIGGISHILRSLPTEAGNEMRCEIERLLDEIAEQIRTELCCLSERVADQNGGFLLDAEQLMRRILRESQSFGN